MLTDQNAIDALMSDGDASDRIHEISRKVDLASGDEIHLGYLPVAQTTIGNWRSAAIGCGWSILAESDDTVVVEGDVRNTDRFFTASLTTAAESGLVTFICLGRRVDCREAYERITRSVSPRVARPVLRQHNFGAIFTDINKRLGDSSELYFKRISARRWISRDKRESSMTWTDRPYRQAFDEARERGSFFRYVSFEVRKGEKLTQLSGGLSRPNMFSMNQAAAPRLVDVASAQLIKHVRHEIELVTDRSRRRLNRIPRPVVADFVEPLFTTDKEIRKVRDHFREYKNATIAVIHGNPYFHARIIDLTDGSTYAVFVTNTKSMLLIPQLRSSEPSFGRLLEFVHDSFGDVRFKDAPKAYA